MEEDYNYNNVGNSITKQHEDGSQQMVPTHLQEAYGALGNLSILFMVFLKLFYDNSIAKFSFYFYSSFPLILSVFYLYKLHKIIKLCNKEMKGISLVLVVVYTSPRFGLDFLLQLRCRGARKRRTTIITEINVQRVFRRKRFSVELMGQVYIQCKLCISC